MSDIKSLPFQQALTIANRLTSYFHFNTVRIAIVGEVLRQWPKVDCIEMLCAPKLKAGTSEEEPLHRDQVIDAFFDGFSHFELVEDLDTEFHFKLETGHLFKLYLCSADSFGFWQAIKTGPRSFVEKTLHPAIRQKDVMVRHKVFDKQNNVIELHTEEQFFELLGLSMVAAKLR